MKIGLVAGVALGLVVFAAPGAFAFQQQDGASAPAASQPEQAAPDQQAPTDKAVGLSDETAPKSEGGTEIRIPGLGKLGVLPKMDFGLELLYGAAEQKQPEGPPQGTPNPDEDLTIRGTVKHRF